MNNHEGSIWSDDDPTLARRGPHATPRGSRPTAAETPEQRPVDDSPPPSAHPWRPRLVAAALVLAGALLGAVLTQAVSGADEPVDSAAGDQPLTTTTAAPSTTAPPASTTTTEAPSITTAPAPANPSAPDWNAVAAAIGPINLPSDCPLPLDVPESLPNSARDYRGGTHEGIDFICGERGHSAVAAMPGQVLVANNSYVEPGPDERLQILDEAKSLGFTPPWTLAMLFGRFVVIDHGVLPGAGHVVSIYAHLDEIDPAIRPGRAVDAGTRLGEVGNRGTESAGTGSNRPQAIHLHWELHVDDTFLGAGLNAAATSEVYAKLFGQ